MPGRLPQGTQNDMTIMTVPEVAQFLRMSEAKVYQLVREQRIPAIRIGKMWRFRKDLLDQWLIQSMESGRKSFEK